jgi:hypothetical protein
MCVTGYPEGHPTLIRRAKDMAIDRRTTVAAMVERCGFMVDRSTVIDPVPVRECLHAAEAIARSRPRGVSRKS